MKHKIRIGLVAIALLGLLTACGGDTAPRNNAKINEVTCIDEAGHNICAAKEQEQITIEVPFNASFADVKNANGDLIGSLTAGNKVRVVCSRWVEGRWFEESWPEYGILMEDVATDQTGVGADRFTTGRVDSSPLRLVGFVPAKFFDRGAIEHDKLRPKLEKKFDEIFAEWSTCDDNRVVVDHAGQSVVAGQPAQ